MTSVQSDSLSDIEVGAEVFSRSIQDAGGWAAGVVFDIVVNEDGEIEFHAVRFKHGHPLVHVFPGSDVAMEHTKFGTKMPRDFAAYIHRWLGRRDNSRMDRTERVRWSGITQILDEVALGGAYLPRAAARFQERLTQRKEAS